MRGWGILLRPGVFFGGKFEAFFWFWVFQYMRYSHLGCEWMNMGIFQFAVESSGDALYVSMVPMDLISCLRRVRSSTDTR